MYGNVRNFMMSHNMELKMPDMMFDGATFRITPRGFEGDGALVKLEMIPKEVDENRPTGRILFKKISKFLKSKCARSRLQSLVSWLTAPASTHSCFAQAQSHFIISFCFHLK